MKNLNINGKYTIKKKNQEIITKNNLTIYGAIQIARFLKRDIVFPKQNSNYFGRIISYNGELKKTRIKDGSCITYPTVNEASSSGFTQSTIYNDGQDLNRNYAIDGSRTSSVIFRFDNSNNSTCYFDLNLKQSKNISRIGIFAQMQRYDDQNAIENCYYISDLSFYVRPQGIQLSYTTNVAQANDLPSMVNLKGSYLRVYNANKPTINGKPYYIKNKPVDTTSTIYHCIYYNGYKWIIGTITIGDINNGDNNTIDKKYCPLIQGAIIETNIGALNQQNLITYNVQVESGDTTIIRQYVITLKKGINKWMKPCNRLHNYLAPFYNSNFDEVFNQKRYLTMLGDTSTSYDRNNGSNDQINYNYISSSFDSMLAYNCYSFQDTQTFNSFYNVLNNRYTVESCYEQLAGFAPYIDAIRFVRQKNSLNNRNAWIKIYAIDLFEPVKAPYNPCKIALTQSDQFTQQNSWFVDSIQKKGQNTIVFTKQLQNNQGVTEFNGFKKIGLFGNFTGHLNGTLPKQVKTIDKNCFSQATFANVWSKTNEEQIIITYQLIIGDQEE